MTPSQKNSIMKVKTGGGGAHLRLFSQYCEAGRSCTVEISSGAGETTLYFKA